MIATIIALSIAAAGLFGGLIAWLLSVQARYFQLSTEVAVLRSKLDDLSKHLGEIDPIEMAKALAWIKGAISALARILHADLEMEDD